MTLAELFGPEQPPVEVRALAFDDRVVEPGTVFFCVPGFSRDGHDFAPQPSPAGLPRWSSSGGSRAWPCPRCSWPTSARRWRRPPPHSTAIPPRG